jgi:hypothetical protein
MHLLSKTTGRLTEGLNTSDGVVKKPDRARKGRDIHLESHHFGKHPASFPVHLLRLKRRHAMRKKLIFVPVAVLIGAALVLANRASAGEENAGAAAADVTLSGTVVDTFCYLQNGNHSAKHTSCSKSCIEKGVPAGFLTDDGTLYMLFNQTPGSVKDKIAGFIDVPAILKGTPMTRGGVKGVQIKSIEKKKS